MSSLPIFDVQKNAGKIKKKKKKIPKFFALAEHVHFLQLL